LYRTAFGPFFPGGVLRTIDDDLTTKSHAAFANGSFQVVPNVRVSAGIRFTRESKDYDRSTSVFLNGLRAAPAFAFNAQDKWTDTSPMASVDWQVTPETMVYARVAKGFKSGGFNGRANTPAEATQYEPETVWSYEGGFKTSIASRLRLNGAIFHNDYRNFQARVSEVDEDPILGVPGARLSVLNAGRLRIRGAELEAAWTPIDQLLIDTQIGYLDAEYKEFVDLRFPGGSRAFQTPAFAPKWTVRVGAQYGFDLGTSGGVTIGGQSRYRARTALAVDNTFVTATNQGTTTEVEGLFQDPFWVHDARIVWENASRKFAVGLYGNNLTDKAYKTDGQDFSTIGGIRTVYYGNPRTVTLRLTARY
jgi:iron complex outermembrane receptor protein